MKNRTYRYFEGEPLYPFGFGLSYSKFEYGSIVLSTRELNAGDPLDVEVDVSNLSSREGDEVLELYLKFPNYPGAPLRALRGVNRIHLRAGEQRRVKFKLDARDLSYVNEAGDRLVGAGEYLVSVGGGQPSTNAAQVSARLSIRGEQKLPE
jgi:beta-glucosidase